MKKNNGIKKSFNATNLTALGAVLFFSFANFASAAPVRGAEGDFWADRVLGHQNFGELNINEITNKRVWNPGGILVDTSSTPNRLYVYDTGNSRILGFSNIANAYTSGSDPADLPAGADIVLGQPDFSHGACNGDSNYQNYPSSQQPNAFCLCSLPQYQISPTESRTRAGMAVDSQGNLYVPDFWNNRVVRYNAPIASSQAAAYVWGRGNSLSNFNSGYQACASPSSSSLCFGSEFNTPAQYHAGVAVDSFGNLWVGDTTNNRVLRFPKDTNPASPTYGIPLPTADVVLGQSSFTTRNTPANANDLSKLDTPLNVRVDSAGNVYVLDNPWPAAGQVPCPSASGRMARLTVYIPTGTGANGFPTYNGNLASAAQFDYVGSQGIELDPQGGGIWVANYCNYSTSQVVLLPVSPTNPTRFTPPSKVLLRDLPFTNGNGSGSYTPGDGPNFRYQTGDSINADYMDVNAVAVDASGNVFLSGYFEQDIWRFPAPIAAPQAGIARSPDWAVFKPRQPYMSNEMGLNGLSGGIGVAVSRSSGPNPAQLIVSSDYRIDFWNMSSGPAGLSNGQPPDGYLGAPNVRSGLLFQRIREDHASPQQHLWVVTGDKADINEIRAYNLPLTTLESPVLTLSVPVPVLGGGSLGWQAVHGLTVDADGTHLWIPDKNHNRVLRIRNPLTNPMVDVVLGQPNLSSSSRNQGGSPAANTLDLPGNVTLDHQGNVYVSDFSLENDGNRRLLRWNAQTIQNAVAASPSACVFNLSADAVFEHNGNFNTVNCLNPNNILSSCGPNEPAFLPDDSRMVVGINPYAGSYFPLYFNNPFQQPLVSPNDNPAGRLQEYGSMNYSATFDEQGNLYTTDLNRNRALVYFNPFSYVAGPTLTRTSTPTLTITLSPTPTGSHTLTPTPTFTETSTHTLTPTFTITLTPTPRPTYITPPHCTANTMEFIDTYNSISNLGNYSFYGDHWSPETAESVGYTVSGGYLLVSPAVDPVYSFALVKNTHFSHALGNYSVEADFQLDGDNTGVFGIVFRANPATANAYTFQWNGYSGQWEIEKKEPDGLLNYPAMNPEFGAYTAGTKVHLKVVVGPGNLFSAYVDGLTVFSGETDEFTPPPPYTAGAVGIRAYEISPERTLRVDNFDAYDCVVGPPSTQTPTKTRTFTKTRTLTITPTRTKTPTITRTFTKTPTPTYTKTPTKTRTMTLTQTPTKTATPTPYVIQAENACGFSGMTVTNHTGYTGSGFVDLANNSAAGITFALNSSSAQNLSISFRYANGSGSTRAMLLSRISPSTSPAVPMNFTATANWDTWTTLAGIVPLVSGNNQFRLVPAASNSMGGPNLDQISFAPDSATTGFCGLTPTPTRTATRTQSSTKTFTAINTPTGTETATSSPTPSPTSTDSATMTASDTSTSTFTATESPSSSPTASETPTETWTESLTQTSTSTSTGTWTNTGTKTSTPTLSPIPSFTPCCNIAWSQTAGALSSARGIAIDHGRNVGYVADNNTVRKFDLATGALTGTVGAGNQFGQPQGINMGPDGNLYVANYSNGTWQKVDPATGNMLVTVGAGDGLGNPRGIWVDTNGDVYLTSLNTTTTLYRYLFTAPSTYTKVTLTLGGTALNTPTGIAKVGNRLFVADSNNNRVVMYRESVLGSNNYDLSTTLSGASPSFLVPQELTADVAGNIYVANFNNSAFTVFFSDGTLRNNCQNAAYGTIFGIGVDAAGNVYVAGVSNQRVSKVGGCLGTPTATSTKTPTATTTPSRTNTASNTATSSRTFTATMTPTRTATGSKTPTASLTASMSDTPTEIPTETSTVSATPSETPTETATFTPTWTQTDSTTPTPTPTESSTDTVTSTETPTETLMDSPTDTPTPTETDTPTEIPTEMPTEFPTETPTETQTPTEESGNLSASFVHGGSASKSLGLFPNPAGKTGSVSLQGLDVPNNTEVKVRIFSLSYRQVFEETFPAVSGKELELPLNDPSGAPLANGLYYVMVDTPKEHWVGKLVVLR